MVAQNASSKISDKDRFTDERIERPVKAAAPRLTQVKGIQGTPSKLSNTV